ncbi:hypothetical protein EON79_24065 [bacterium]|nr:MAG: hypothetical protein EON79_24065 [bacterium]
MLTTATIRRSARREGRQALRRIVAVVSTFLAPWLLGFIAIGEVDAATVLLALGLINVLAATALCSVLGRRAERRIPRA